MPKRGKAIIDTQLSIAVPEGTYGRVAPRSGLGQSLSGKLMPMLTDAAAKHSIDTGAGVIDADYRGTVMVLLFNYSDEDFSSKSLDEQWSSRETDPSRSQAGRPHCPACSGEDCHGTDPGGRGGCSGIHTAERD